MQPLKWLPCDPSEIISTKCARFQVSRATFIQVCGITLPSAHTKKEEWFKDSHFSSLLAELTQTFHFECLSKVYGFSSREPDLKPL